MEIIRMTTWINAPLETCFKLATNAEFHVVLAQGAKKSKSDVASVEGLIPGDRLIWPGRCAGLQLKYTARIDAIRPPCYFREVRDGGYFELFEHDHHFTYLNDGTRMRDEIRFVVPPGAHSLLMVPLVRRYIISQIAHRNQLLKATAESEAWKKYLHPASGQLDNPVAGPHQSQAAKPSGIPAGQMATHRG